MVMRCGNPGVLPAPTIWGGYMIVDLHTNGTVAGTHYEMTLDDVAEFLEG